MPIVNGIHRIFVISAVTSILYGCGLSSPCNQIEVKRVGSVDKKVEAVLIKNDCGATTSDVYSVSIMGIGEKLNDKNIVFKADHIEGLLILWRGEKFLEIKYKQARIFHFTNFWQSKEVDNFSYIVEVRETSLSKFNALSPRDRWVK